MPKPDPLDVTCPRCGSAPGYLCFDPNPQGTPERFERLDCHLARVTASVEPKTIDHGRYTLRHDWPDDCFVQGSRLGVVFAPGGKTYTTAFVEAFPRNPDTFIRGEGADVATAEDAAWEKYLTVTGCTHSNGYDRRGYRNGAGFCKDCGMFASGVFDLTEIGSVCVVCGVGTYWVLRDGQIYCAAHDPRPTWTAED